ncbi:MAG TPA: hypothetical protein VN896_10220 [Methylomirabilota bacterium]|nr:hypothetical protein [Methylomirabilota bacterium]
MLDTQTLLLLAALAGPHDSSAPLPSANDTVLASVIAPLVSPGQKVRVRTRFGVTQGTAGTVSPRGLEMRCAQGDGWSLPCGEPIAWSQIQRIDVSKRHPGHVAKIGAVFGALIGLAYVTGAASDASDEGTGPDAGQALFAGALGGITGLCVGGFVGRFIDRTVPSWKTVFERR